MALFLDSLYGGCQLLFILQGRPGPAGTPGVSGRRGAIGPKVCGLVFLVYLR